MQKEEAEKYLGMQIKVITHSNLHFSGKIIDVTEDSIILIDKYSCRVTISFSDICLLSEVKDGSY